jgi:hypothetical protein
MPEPSWKVLPAKRALLSPDKQGSTAFSVLAAC